MMFHHFFFFLTNNDYIALTFAENNLLGIKLLPIAFILTFQQ